MKLLEHWLKNTKISDYIAWREKRYAELQREITINRDKAQFYRNICDFQNMNIINATLDKLIEELKSIQTHEHVKRLVIRKEVVHGRY